MQHGQVLATPRAKTYNLYGMLELLGSEHNETIGDAMSACNFEFLLQLINKQLDLDKQIEVYDHLERCDICRDAAHQISCDLKGAHYVKAYAIRGQINAAGSGRAQPVSR
jgi:hypothetical protein